MIGTSVMKELKNAHNCQITIFFKKLMSCQPSSITGSAIIMCIIFLFTIKLKLSQRHVSLPITLENVWERVTSTGLTSLEKLKKRFQRHLLSTSIVIYKVVFQTDKSIPNNLLNFVIFRRYLEKAVFKLKFTNLTSEIQLYGWIILSE